MPTTPNGATGSLFYTGRKFRNAVVTGVIPNGTGVTRQSYFDISAAQTVDSMEFDGELDLIEISAANALVKNYAPQKDDFTVTITEIMSNAGYPDVLAMWESYQYYLIEAVVSPTADIDYANNGGPLQFVPGTTNQGSGGSVMIQAPGIRQSIRWGYSEGREAAILTVKPIGLPIAVVGIGGSLVYP